MKGYELKDGVIIMNLELTDLDYVSIYAKKLKEDNKYFKQQKMLIESQLKASQSLFKNTFKENFKKEAREYIKARGLI